MKDYTVGSLTSEHTRSPQLELKYSSMTNPVQEDLGHRMVFSAFI